MAKNIGTDEIEQIALNALSSAQFDVEIFNNRMLKQVQLLEEAGLSAQAITASLEQDMLTGGRIFGELKNAINASIVLGINESARLGQYSNYDIDKGEFVWITVGGHKICSDCSGREGNVGTFDYHESEGLPGSGWSVCQAYCYCVLDPTGKIPTSVSRVDVRESGS